MQVTYGLLPIIAGLDKFTDILVDWENYLSPLILKVLPMSPHSFMIIGGIIEIIVGILVFTRYKKIAAYIISIWLLLITINLITGGYYDIALRDIVIAIGAFAFAELTKLREEPKISTKRA